VAILQQKAHFSASLDEKLGMGFCSGLPQRAALIFVNIPSSLSPSLGRNHLTNATQKIGGFLPDVGGNQFWDEKPKLALALEA